MRRGAVRAVRVGMRFFPRRRGFFWERGDVYVVIRVDPDVDMYSLFLEEIDGSRCFGYTGTRAEVLRDFRRAPPRRRGKS